MNAGGGRREADRAQPGGNPPRLPVVWLETNSCCGNILSTLNSLDPTFREILQGFLDLRYCHTLMAAEGEMADAVLRECLGEGGYTLVVEGTVPTAAGGYYAVVGRKNGRPWTALEAVQEVSTPAKHVVAVGSCAAFGGPFAAAPNPSGSKPLSAVVARKVINVPGCPVHPDWVLGTLAALAWYGEPELDALNRPRMFYEETIHNHCTRRYYFESGIFAKEPGEPWCMYKLGCKGSVTFADCPLRQWSGEHQSWPVGVNTPCIGCTSPEFPDGTSPFFEHLPDIRLPNVRVAANRVGLVTGAAAALGIGVHFIANVLTGRLKRVWGKKK
ncbi:MAG: hydrogenase small subunit [Thermoanaerobacterales bacterium]|nr:hydrogenase small subunit [Thermoanaerobacterales bacterium]